MTKYGTFCVVHNVPYYIETIMRHYIQIMYHIVYK